MKLSELKMFFDKQIPYSVLQSAISEEVNFYRSQLSERGRSAPLVVDQDTRITIRNEELKTLCEAYLNSEIDNYELYYIVDILLLASFGSDDDNVSFSNEELREKFESLTDPEINFGALTPKIVMEILNS